MKKKILIIEDENNLAELLKINLEAGGYDVINAFDAEDGLMKVFNELPDIITLDVQLPGIDGWEACRRIKTNPRTKDIPVIFITVIPKEEGYEKAISLGADYYLTKPFVPTDLIEIIRKVVNSRK